MLLVSIIRTARSLGLLLAPPSTLLFVVLCRRTHFTVVLMVEVELIVEVIVGIVVIGFGPG